MPKSGKEIRRRIRSVKNTQQITKAMKMVASARLRKSQNRTEASRPYAETLQSVMRRLSGEASDVEHPFLNHIAPDVPRVGLILMTSDKGLCGSFNSNLTRRAGEFIRSQREAGNEVELVAVGKKGRTWARSMGYEMRLEAPAFSDKSTYADISAVTNVLTDLYLHHQVSEVYLVFARFINVAKNEPTVVRLLPIETLAGGAEEPEEHGYEQEYILEPSPEELLASLLPSYFRTVLFQAALENYTSENGARMVAMDNATSAAGDMIEELTLQYNKARQAGITLELLDIVGGAEALKG
jgi:F-type H+-transporting ATPase subunit gamma